ncbi:hypothetical protein FOZ63_027090 [Perkinsus olseni]|uniref:Uncharacterized protein n=2 Tax=Perkinsus olseni TaxID=32597 RepID=A0A7J6SN38_PEROL|nr:hypothetical protein FOZ63_027090 [Perkinsus olseni]
MEAESLNLTLQSHDEFKQQLRKIGKPKKVSRRNRKHRDIESGEESLHPTRELIAVCAISQEAEKIGWDEVMAIGNAALRLGKGGFEHFLETFRRTASSSSSSQDGDGKEKDDIANSVMSLTPTDDEDNDDGNEENVDSSATKSLCSSWEEGQYTIKPESEPATMMEPVEPLTWIHGNHFHVQGEPMDCYEKGNLSHIHVEEQDHEVEMDYNSDDTDEVSLGELPPALPPPAMNSMVRPTQPQDPGVPKSPIRRARQPAACSD